MKKLYKGLTLLAIIPLLASCSSSESMDNKKALALVKGETYEGVDYKDYAHTKEKVLAVADHVKATYEFDEKISEEEFAKYETGKDEHGEVVNAEKYTDYKVLERIRVVAISPLYSIFAATYVKYLARPESYEEDLNIQTAETYVIAQSLLEDYETLRASDTVKDYPYSESTYLEKASGELVIDYSLSYLAKVSMIVKVVEKDEDGKVTGYHPAEMLQEVGFSMNAQATFTKEGAVKDISVVIAAAHERNGDDSTDLLDTFDYYDRASFTFEYSKTSN